MNTVQHPFNEIEVFVRVTPDFFLLSIEGRLILRGLVLISHPFIESLG